MIKVQLLLSYLIILAHSCTYLYNNTLFLTGTLQEVINIPLSSIFHRDSDEKVTLKQTNAYLTLGTPITKYLEKQYGGTQNAKFISQKLYKSTRSRDPINHITLLVLHDGIYSAESNIGIYQQLPDISMIQEIVTKQKSICYDIIQLDDLNIVECDDEQKNSYFSIMDLLIIKQIDIEKPISDFRKMDQIDNYLFRGTENKIYVYIKEEGNLNQLTTLDETILKNLLQKDQFKLSIKDFQTHTNGQLSIMNAFGELIIVQYKNNQWELIKIFETHLNDSEGYDYNIFTNTYAIISKTKLLYQQRDQGQVIIEIQNQDALSKIQITKRNLLLSQNNSVKVLNQRLELLQTLLFDNNQIFLNTNPNAEGFMIMQNNRMSAYSINDYYYFLQLSFVSRIVDGYEKATLIQENYPRNCEVTIFYKTEDFGYQQILLSQQSQGLIVGGVNIDSNQIKIRPIYQGSNLKYQFQANSLIKIEIDKHTSIKFNNIPDTLEVGYRKILKGNGLLSYYLIQQNNDLQLKGYICEGTLEQNCKIQFTQDQFKKLLDSFEQLWWSNQESLFFALVEGTTITIYVQNTQTNNFEILTTINLESNVKQIVTDGFHLIVLIEDKTQVYEITISNQAKLTTTFNLNAQKKIYASQNVRNQLFIQSQTNLYLYDIEYDFQTLIWSENVQDQQETNVIIFENHFVRLNKNLDQYYATVFNYKNKRNIYQEKQISFNEYSDIKLSTIEYSYDNNLLYINGYSKQTKSQVVLVYKIRTTSLDSLFYLINITPTTSFSVAGNYILLTDITNKQIENYYINGDLLVSSKQNRNYYQIQYTKQLQLDFVVTNDVQTILAQSISMNSVNKGGKILQINDKINLNYLQKNDTIHCVDLGQDWYAGQVFDIKLLEQSTKIKFNPPLTIEKDYLESSLQIQEFNNSNLLVQLMSNKLTLVSKDDFTQQEFTLDQAYKFTTILMIVEENIYVQAQTKDSIWLRIIQCKDYKDCTLLDTKLNVQKQIKKVFLHQNNFFMYVGNYVQVYDTMGDKIKLEQFELIQSFSQNSYLIQMEFIHLQGDTYQFISVDNYGNLEFQMREISRTSTKNQFVRYMINTLITEQGINLQEIQQSAGFVLRKNQITIIFKNSASYSFDYEIDCSRNELCEIIKFKFNGLYQQYQDWQLDQFYSKEDILLLVFTFDNHYQLFIYDMEIQSNNSKPNNIIARIASPDINIEQNTQILSFIYTFNSKLHLLTSIENSMKLNHYSLIRSYQLCINESKFEEAAKFNLSNTDYQISVEEKLKIEEYKPPSPPDEKGKFPIWAIILIIIGVLFIGGAIYMLCKKRKNKYQNTNLLLEN